MALVRGVELRRDEREHASRHDVHTKARDEARIADTSAMAQIEFMIGNPFTPTIAETLLYWM
jgi:hypothetical protein